MLGLGLSIPAVAARGRGGGAPAFTPASLFASGEQGAFFDASDLTSMRQGRTGATAAAVGSPVGYWFDKRLMGGQSADAFIASQPELAPNLATPDTILGTGVTWVDNGDGSFTFTDPVGGNTRPLVQFNNVFPTPLDASRRYLVSYTIVASSPHATRVSAFSGGETAFSGAGTVNRIINGPTNNGHLQIGIESINTTAGATFTIRDVSLREVPGNHATAPSDAARPVLRQTAGGLYYLEFDGTDDRLDMPAFTTQEFLCGVLLRAGRTFGRIAGNTSTNGNDIQVGSSGVGWNNLAEISTLTRSNGLQQVNGANYTNSEFSLVGDAHIARFTRGTGSSGAVVNIGNGFENRPLSINLYNLVLIDRALTAQEVTDVNTFLAARSGVTL
jgi:hypothetical protein